MRKASVERNRPLSGELYPRPLVETYFYLFRKYPEESWDRISLRKQVCLLYVQWMVSPHKKEYKEAMIEKVKEWRKKEPGRMGTKRSVLEKLCRRFFQEARLEKSNSEEVRKARGKSARRQLENKTAQHTPEMAAYRKTSEFGKWLASFQKVPVHALHWYVYPPEGGVLEVFNLRAFSREHGLDPAHMHRTSKYPGLKHKGWRAEKRNMDIERVVKGPRKKKRKGTEGNEGSDESKES